MRALLSMINAEQIGRTAVTIPRPVRGTWPITDAKDTDAIEVDANGSPVSIEASTWFICFVPGLRRQWWHRFADARHKHVFALRSLGDGNWLLVEPWWTRLMVNVLTLDQAVKFLRWGASGDILKVRESIPGRGSQMRGWSNCSVLMSFLLGRSYWTWTPNGLFRKLRREPDVEQVNVHQLLREYFLVEANRNANAALKASRVRQGERFDEVLVELGMRVFSAMTSSAAIGLHKAAVSEHGRFGDAADAFWTFGPERAVEHIRGVLLDPRIRSEVRPDDCDAAARAFLAMLRSNLYLEIVFGLRPSLDMGEVREHVMSVVDVFLRGAWLTGALPVASVAEPRALVSDAGPPAANLLIHEIGASVRESVRSDDWQSVSAWAEAL
ncbi:TetR/AcrR family transcriptional regulator C-terminal domain-containing protein [Lysobacter sp. S4-A87]|uniref:TetR/AcrR family transcriptional regulator C-terminal domain-containing protein n=1 Tax=Lysobacter sp. S4-A87 TaxID=2925843 RepID=UPI001F52DF53|nr:TetR/AcrR family transcriptional regulator C-terminal domain-containing protein [Lysobacter sp. S4-A87]UNK48710.1 TetR/AcrR family transcriptional regulator C-terminal domain-containing protein [Lysobacter sp. S4-A87]